ncbi:hypothetical protein L1987_00026 [Smallanthus sonchifolius]|uniref:Uncharacterized protein n=1 Tax=Smallanthus sonchifolius TaxID=185202 RepID=A0ACB9K160_9ASTR|nr:hypothetical protein L1987_00026 [Smallanthus sonchifolius]
MMNERDRVTPDWDCCMTVYARTWRPDLSLRVCETRVFAWHAHVHAWELGFGYPSSTQFRSNVMRKPVGRGSGIQESGRSAEQGFGLSNWTKSFERSPKVTMSNRTVMSSGCVERPDEGATKSVTLDVWLPFARLSLGGRQVLAHVPLTVVPPAAEYEQELPAQEVILALPAPNTPNTTRATMRGGLSSSFYKRGRNAFAVRSQPSRHYAESGNGWLEESDDEEQVGDNFDLFND